MNSIPSSISRCTQQNHHKYLFYNSQHKIILQSNTFIVGIIVGIQYDGFFRRTVFNTFNENFSLRYSSLTTFTRVHLNKLSMRLEISIWEVLYVYDFPGIVSTSTLTLNFSQLQWNKNIVSNFHIIQTTSMITHSRVKKSMPFTVMC